MKATRKAQPDRCPGHGYNNRIAYLSDQMLFLIVIPHQRGLA